MLTVKEAAELIGVSVRRVHCFLDDGRLPFVRKSPRLFLIRPRDAERFAKIPRLTGAAGHKKNLRRVDKCS